MKEIKNRIIVEDSKVGIKDIFRSFSSLIKKGYFARAEDSLYKMSPKEQSALQEAQKVVRDFKPNSGPRFQYHIDESSKYRRKIKS